MSEKFLRAWRLIDDTAKCPRMYARTRESFLMRITSILEVIIENFQPGPFALNHIDPRRADYELSLPVDDAWACEVVKKGLQELNRFREEERALGSLSPFLIEIPIEELKLHGGGVSDKDG